jgi:hypothetical protein
MVRALHVVSLSVGAFATLAACADPPFDEAPHLAAPQAQTLGGPVLAHPTVVPVLFAGDPFVDSLTQFHAALPTASYWHTTTAEYGVGALSTLPAIVSTDAPPTSDDELQAWLRANADGSHPGWPRASADTIYAVFLPDGAALTLGDGTSCKVFEGYHSETTDAVGGSLLYAVVARCIPSVDTKISLDRVTGTASHEYVEAATDPHPFTAPAYLGIDADDYVWSIAPGVELGDLCENRATAVEDLVAGFAAQRTWSNAAAAAGDDPCVPAAPGSVYIAATPQALDDVDVLPADGGAPVRTKGLAIPVGETRTIGLALWSTGPADIHVDVIPGHCTARALPDPLKFTLDRADGHNGDVLQLTITHVAAGDLGGNEFCITTETTDPIPDADAQWFGFIAN